MTTRFKFAIIGYCAATAVACTTLPEIPREKAGAADGGGKGVEDANAVSDGVDAVKGTGFDGRTLGSDTAADLSADTGVAETGVADAPLSPPDGVSVIDLGSARDTATGIGIDVPALSRDTAVDVGADAASGVDSSQSSCTPETDTQMCTRLGRVCGAASGTDNCGTTRTPNCGPASRLCSQDGLLGTCGGGSETCNVQGRWGTCSIQPSASGLDTCAPGNDDNCNGIVNQGCLCIEGTTRTCGPCNDGAQTCTNGKSGTYGACTGGTQQTVYYRDADGDGYGGTTTILACGGAPTGYVALGGDCCDSDSAVNPGVPATAWFTTASKCGTFDYDCDGIATQEFPTVATACAHSGTLFCTDGGWTTAVQGCGVTGDWSDCQRIVTDLGTAIRIDCNPQATTGTQACR
jgi:hypothetical protein